MKLMRWLARHRPEIEVIATIVWIVAGELRDTVKRRGRRR